MANTSQSKSIGDFKDIIENIKFIAVKYMKLMFFFHVFERSLSCSQRANFTKQGKLEWERNSNRAPMG